MSRLKKKISSPWACAHVSIVFSIAGACSPHAWWSPPFREQSTVQKSKSQLGVCNISARTALFTKSCPCCWEKENIFQLLCSCMIINAEGRPPMDYIKGFLQWVQKSYVCFFSAVEGHKQSFTVGTSISSISEKWEQATARKQFG